MCEFKIKIADKTVRIKAIHEVARRFCKSYLVDFSSVEDFSVEVTEEMLSSELQRQSYDGRPDPQTLTDSYVEIVAICREIAERIVDDGVILFHGSAIAVDSEGYIFTAVSGTGKSTHTRLWRERFGERAVMVNDDKPLISFKDGVPYVHGTPWNGKHNIDTNISVPIKAICILERSENNRIERVLARDAFPFIYQQTYRSKDVARLSKTLPLVDKLSRSVPIYRLGCNMDPDAARVSYEGMQNSKEQKG